MLAERNLNGYQEDQFDRMEVISGGKRLWKRLKAFSLFRLRLTRSVQGSFPFSGIELAHFGPYPYGHSVITAPAQSVVNESTRELRVKLQASVVLDAFRLVVEPGTSTTIRWILEGSKDGSSWIPLHMQDSGLRVNRYRAWTKTEKTQWFSTRAVALGTKGLHSCGRFARVLNTADCEAAAQQLWMDDTSVSDDGQSGKTFDPPYCYYEGSSLKYNSDGSNTGECSHYDKCLCINATATAAAAAAANTTTWQTTATTTPIPRGCKSTDSPWPGYQEAQALRCSAVERPCQPRDRMQAWPLHNERR